MRTAKRIVYRYNGDASTDEVEEDILGDQEVPQKNSIVNRKQGNWKVVQVELIEAESLDVYKRQAQLCMTILIPVVIAAFMATQKETPVSQTGRQRQGRSSLR